MELILVDSSVDLGLGSFTPQTMTWYILEAEGQDEPFADGDIPKLQLSKVIDIDDSSPTTIMLTMMLDKQWIHIILCTCRKNRDHPGNLFRRLWNRFHSDVKLTICLKYAPNADDVEFMDLATFEGLLIKEKRVEVVARTANNWDRSTFGFDTDFMRLHVKIVAHFSVPPLVSMPSPVALLPNKKIFEEELLSDVTIVAANGFEIKAHKSFLAAWSPVLMATFKNKMQESETGWLDMTDVSQPGIMAFLRYVYYGDLKGLKEDVGVAFNVLYAAHKYHVGNLEAEAVQSLMKRKNDDYSAGVAFKIYMFAKNVESLVGLKARIVRILKTKLDELESLEEFQELFEEKSKAKIAREVFKDFAKLSST